MIPLQIRLKPVSLVFSLLILLVFLGSITQSTMAVVAYDLSSHNTSYYVFLKNITDGYITLYLLDRDMNVFLLPLSSLLSTTCIMNNSIIPDANYIQLVQFFANITLPNGTVLQNVFISIADYMGCGQGEPRIVGVTEDWRNGLLTVHVFVPINNASYYFYPAIFYSSKALIEYRYINETCFETDVIIYDLSDQYGFGIQSMHVKSYNVTFRFIVDTRTWTAKYWDGEKWVPCGTLPLALPILDARLMLYDFYKNYYSYVHYYMTHPSELKTLVEKLESMLKNKGVNETIIYLRSMFNNLLPQIWVWRGSRWFYLGNHELKYYGSGFIVCPKKLIIHIPGFKDLLPDTYDLSGGLKQQVIKAIEKYLATGDLRDLQELITRYNGFIKYRVNDVGPDECDYEWVSVEYAPMLGGDALTLLPPPGNIVNLVAGSHPSYVYLEASPGSNNNIVELKVAGDPSPGVIEERTGLNGFTGIAIDSRLARQWFLVSKASVDFDRRINLLLNLQSVIENSFVNMWYNIITGSDPKAAMKSFLSGLKQAVLTTAGALGGRDAVSLMEYTIREDNPYVLPLSTTSSSMTPRETQAQPPINRNTLPGPISSTNTMTTNGPSIYSTTAHAAENHAFTGYSSLYIVVVILVGLAAITVYAVLRKKHK